MKNHLLEKRGDATDSKALKWLQRHRIAVLKGGWSRERSISLKTGAAVEKALEHLGIRPRVIDVDKNALEQLKKKRVEFAVIALHGAFGEDGALQCLLDFLKIPYTGSGPLASGIAMDKHLSKRLFVQRGVPTAEWNLVSASDRLSDVIPAVKRYPVFVKPADQGSAIGAGAANNAAQLRSRLRACFQLSDRALVEQMISGRELTVGILGNTALPIVEILPKHAFYDFHSKYAPGGSVHVTPAQLPSARATAIQKIALNAFRALGCEVYGRVDVMLTKQGKPYVLEVNTIPGMTATSLLPDAAKAVNIDFDQLVLKICTLSLRRHGVL